MVFFGANPDPAAFGHEPCRDLELEPQPQRHLQYPPGPGENFYNVNSAERASIVVVTTDLPGAISRELAASGLSPDPGHFNYVSARLQHFGEIEYAKLRMTMGGELERKAKSAVHLLGFGRVITEFATAHLPISGKPPAAVLSLGALANLIVSTYDGLVDSGRGPDGILPRSRLTGGGLGRDNGDPFVERLVDLYFAGVSCLPYPHVPVYRTLRSAILRMYDAERVTVGSHECSRAVWRRKSALPFVIMGLPVWMTAPSLETGVYRAHSKWLYRLGQFFGWIDDAADLNDDRSAGRFNYLSSHMTPQTARRIAHHAIRILESWDPGAPEGRYGRTLRQTFLAVTWSWLRMYKPGESSR